MKFMIKSDLKNELSPTNQISFSYLQQFMPDLTAKVFRTYNASFTLETQLQLYDADRDGTSQEALVSFYNEANKKVFILNVSR